MNPGYTKKAHILTTFISLVAITYQNVTKFFRVFKIQKIRRDKSGTGRVNKIKGER
jgi:hypothetical protein